MIVLSRRPAVTAYSFSHVNVFRCPHECPLCPYQSPPARSETCLAPCCSLRPPQPSPRCSTAAQGPRLPARPWTNRCTRTRSRPTTSGSGPLAPRWTTPSTCAIKGQIGKLSSFSPAVAANFLPPSVDHPREPCPGSGGELTHTPVRRISCSPRQPHGSCSSHSLVIGILRDSAAIEFLPVPAAISDVPAAHALLTAAPAQPGRPPRLRLRSVHSVVHPAHALPQVQDNALDPAAQHSPVDTASTGQPKVHISAAYLVQQLLAQALPAYLTRPSVLSGLPQVAPPRHHQVPPLRAAQPYQPPAGPHSALTCAAAPAASHPASQQQPPRQVVPLPPLHLAHAVRQVSAPPRRDSLPEARVTASPSYRSTSQPAKPCPWNRPARSVLKVASRHGPALAYCHVSAASTRPYRSRCQYSLCSPRSPNNTTSSHSVTFR